MSLPDYRRAIELYHDDEPFYALVMAAMLRADSHNIDRLAAAFPETYDELAARYHAPAGELHNEEMNR